MRNSFRAVFLLVAMLAANAAFAQLAVLFSVENWPRLSAREDGMGQAVSFNMGFTNPNAFAAGAQAPSAGKITVQDSVLVLPVGDAAMRFTQAVLRNEMLKTVVVQFAPGGAAKPAPPAFQARLVDVLVASVNIVKSGNDGGPGLAEIKLRAAKIDMFNNTADPQTGVMRGGIKSGYDVRTQKAF